MAEVNETEKNKLIFLPSITGHNLYEGFYKDGFLYSKDKFKDNHLYIIGLDISYDTLKYHEFIKFALLSLSENAIANAYLNLFGENKLKKRLEQQTSYHNLFLEILNHNKEFDVFYRQTNISKYLNKKEIKRFSDQDMIKLMVVNSSDNPYAREGLDD